MKRFLLFFIILASFTSVDAGPRRLLIIDSQDGEPYDSARISMIKELARRGYIQGKTIDIKRRNANNKVGLARRILMDQADTGYDVIFLNGTVASIAAYNYGYNNPQYKFVFCSVTDPVGIGVVKALGKPSDSNFTGVAYPVSVERRLSFLREVLPKAKKIGFIYADMPQSTSYIGWLKDVLKLKKFSDLEILYRKVEFVSSNKGHHRMAQLAREHVLELDSIVDVFLTPNDQLGSKKDFAQIVSQNSKKPLMALTEKEIRENWGAHFGYFTVQRLSGKKAGEMVVRVLKGDAISKIIPVNPIGDYGINIRLSNKIGLKYPKSALEKAGKNIYY